MTLYFSLCAYVKENIRIGSELINTADLQNKYPQLAPIKPTQYTHEDVEVIIRQDYYHAVRPIEFILGDDKNSPYSVRLPIGWVISGPLQPSIVSTFSCFKCVVEDSSLTDQIKSWFELESYGAFKQVDAHSAADKHALSILNSETVHNGERYIVLCLCFGLIVMSVYQTTITRHSPNLKHWREGSVKTLNCTKDTQTQLERTLGKAMSLPSNCMIHVSVPIASGIFRPIPS